MVEWSFPENSAAVLSQFCIIVNEKVNGKEVYRIPASSQERCAHIVSCLQPLTVYIVTVVAEYSDKIIVETSKEYTLYGKYFQED